MTTLVNPTKEQISEYCKNLEKSLLQAIDQGNEVTIRQKYLLKPVNQPGYDTVPVDYTITGCTFSAKIKATT